MSFVLRGCPKLNIAIYYNSSNSSPSSGPSHVPNPSPSPGPSHECPTMDILKIFNELWTFSGILGSVWYFKESQNKKIQSRFVGIPSPHFYLSIKLLLCIALHYFFSPKGRLAPITGKYN